MFMDRKPKVKIKMRKEGNYSTAPWHYHPLAWLEGRARTEVETLGSEDQPFTDHREQTEHSSPSPAPLNSCFSSVGQADRGTQNKETNPVSLRHMGDSAAFRMP